MRSVSPASTRSLQHVRTLVIWAEACSCLAEVFEPARAAPPTERTTLLHATNTPAAAPPSLESFWWSHNETSRGHMLLPNKSATRNIGLPSQRTSSGSFRQVARPSRSRGRQATMSQRDCHVVHRFQKAMLSPGYRMSFSPCKTRCEGVRND